MGWLIAIGVVTVVVPVPLGTTALMPVGKFSDGAANSRPMLLSREFDSAHPPRHKGTSYSFACAPGGANCAPRTGGKAGSHLHAARRDTAPPAIAARARWPRLEIEPAYRRRSPAPLQVEAAYRGVLPGAGAFGRSPAPWNGGRPAIALTFDTEIPRGEEARRTFWRVLDILEAAHVHSTFFVVGRWARANAEALRRLANDGHEIGNHSATHARFAGRGAGTLAAELESVSELVAAETGAPIAPLFRPPYGCLDSTGARIAAAQGYRLAGWTASGRDASSATTDATEVVDAIARDIEPGSVVLLHTNRWVTAEALPGILDLARERGFDVVPLSELFDQHPEVEARVERSVGACGDHTAIARR